MFVWLFAGSLKQLDHGKNKLKPTFARVRAKTEHEMVEDLCRQAAAGPPQTLAFWDQVVHFVNQTAAAVTIPGKSDVPRRQRPRHAASELGESAWWRHSISADELRGGLALAKASQQVRCCTQQWIVRLI